MREKFFTVTEEHVKLMKCAYTQYDDCEFGAPGIDCKRPFGNSDVYGDIAEILGIESSGDDYEEFSDEQQAYMLSVFGGLRESLEILLRTLQLTPGKYVSKRYGDWEKVENA